MSVEYKNSILWRGEDQVKKKFVPAYDAGKKVVRYFPGKAPRWAEDAKGAEAPDASAFSKKAEKPNDRERDRDRRRDRDRDKDRRRERAPAAAVVVEDAAVGRLKRLAEAAKQGGTARTERLLRHRNVHDATVLEDAGQKAEDDSDGEVKTKVEEKPVAITGLEEGFGPKRESKFEEPKDEKEPKEEKEEEDEASDDDDLDIDRKPDLKTEKKEKEEVKDDKAEEEEHEVSAEDLEVRRKLQQGLRQIEQDTEALASARLREVARERAVQRRKQEEEALLQANDVQEEEEDEEESEEESGSDDEDPRRASLMKPVFVSKAMRDTIKEKEALALEEEKAKEKLEKRVEDRKVESKEMLVDVIKRDEDMEREGLNENDGSDIELIDDDDEKNEAEEYELWKIRELKRIKRDKEERLERQKELEWIAKRRSMTDAEREEDDRKLDASSKSRDDVKAFNFLQKYYHRGGFFQDKARTGEEPLYLRDYHEPTEEEKFDKKLLPEAMQLRRGQFGKKGQVKHTHLSAVDTTDKSAAWANSGAKPIQKYQEKMAAASGVENFDRPSASSSKKRAP